MSRFLKIIIFLAVWSGSSFAQRPSNASVCDYYAQNLYGTNSSVTQQNLIRHIVALAFEGGTGLSNVSSALTGILQPGIFSGVEVDLRQYFNGSRASTNVNNAPIGINWLDEGGTKPLSAFLTGQTETVVLTNSTNQYHLFGNFFVVFSRLFGCTIPFPSLPNSGGPVSLAYAHKFMNLDFNQLSYFISQLTEASLYYGFSAQDAESFRTRLNSQYNVRCAPAVQFSPSSPPQLLSLCQNPTCPLAVPVSDCAAYANLTANGIVTSSPTTVVTTTTATVSVAAGPSDSGIALKDDKESSPNTLSTGAIAGIAIGGAAVAILGMIALLLLVRKRRSNSTSKKDPATTVVGAAAPGVGEIFEPGWDAQRFSTPATLYQPDSQQSPKHGSHVISYYSTGQSPSEMDSSQYQSPAHTRLSSPEMAAHAGRPTFRPVELGGIPTRLTAPIEIDGAPIDGLHQSQGPSQSQYLHEGGTSHEQQDQQYQLHQDQYYGNTLNRHA